MLSQRHSLVQAAAVVASVLATGGLALAQDEAAADEREPVLSKECVAYSQDEFANVGAVLAAGCKPSTAQMSRLMDNPLGNVAMWINQFDWLRLANDEIDRKGENQFNYMGILQFPVGISEKWNIINRVVYNIPSSPIDQDKIDALGSGSPSQLPPSGPTQPPPLSLGLAPIDFLGGRTSGFGDLIYLGLASPKAGIKHGPGQTSVWGLGLGLTLPSATDDVLGSGKWSAGPAALYAYLGKKWKLGGLVQTYFSYAGKDRHDDVGMMNTQLFYYYSINETVSIGAGPNIIVNFEADKGEKWTVPLGMGINKTVNIGKLPVRFALEYYYSVVRPDTIGATHNLRFMVIPAVPSGLIPFLR